MRYLVLFFMIMGLRGGLFAQVATPILRTQAQIDSVVSAYLNGDAPALRPILPVIPKNALEFNTNAIPLKWGLGFISGAARGLNQTIAFHPDRFFARYPNADRGYWDNSISWRNKWRNGDPQQGEAFLGSSTVFVWSTDALHLSGTISNVTGVASLSIPLYKGCGKMNLWRHLAQVGITSAGYWLGFHSVYSWWFQ